MYGGFDRFTFDNQMDKGRRLIGDVLQATRVSWASSWLYYGNDPPEPDRTRVTKDLERQMWCVWVIQQDFHVQPDPKTGGFGVFGASEFRFGDTGPGILFGWTDNPVTYRLYEEFNAPLEDYVTTSNSASPSKSSAETQLQKIRAWPHGQGGSDANLVRILRPQPRILQPINDLFTNGPK